VGDLGGVFQIFGILFGIVCFPISHFCYNLKMASLLFIARTKETSIFKEHTEEFKAKFENHCSKEVFKNDYEINISFKDSVILFISQYISISPRICHFGPKFNKLYHRGCEKLESHFSIVKLLKRVDSTNAFLKNGLMTKKMKHLIKHSHENVINLESSAEECHEHCSFGNNVEENDSQDPLSAAREEQDTDRNNKIDRVIPNI